LAMCRLAAAENGLFTVDDREVRRAGPSYTLDTARELRADGIDPVHWMIGADMLRLLPKWHQPEALLKEVDFVIVARPGWTFDWDTMPPAFRHLQSHVVIAPLIDISATDIRARARAKQPIDHLVPKSVARYIEEHKLYQK
jgi:nicotinate-nucleotide adenylyltransferase